MADNPIQPENKPQKPPTRITIKPALPKSETTRIDLASAKPPPSIFDKKDLPADADDYFKRSTMRIELPGDQAKSATARIELPAEDAAAKKQTARINISAPSAARPIRPGMAAPSRPVPVPGESSIITPAAGAADQARKSETARIDLKPEDLDRPAKPKTIRIKRPDGTSGRKPLAIARPSGAPQEAPGISAVAEPASSMPESEQPGLLAGISAIAALLVVSVLFYVLLAQTLAPNLPFPGKI